MNDRTLTSNAKSFQRRVLDWMMETFSMEITRDTTERNHRYLEESLELVQAMGCTQSEAHQLVDYVYGRPVGEPQQEVGGALVTLAALCSAADFDMTECGNRELARCWQNIDRIRAKQAGKPKHSPLPEHAPETPEQLRVRLAKDIYDDGQDHHPPGYVGRKGDMVVIHSIQTAVVSHRGTGGGFVVHDGELELSGSQKANSCVCGEPNSPGTHRTDGPCLAPIGDRR